MQLLIYRKTKNQFQTERRVQICYRGRRLILLLVGSAVGLALGSIATQVLAQIGYQASPRDPVVLAGVMATMVLLGLIGIWIPAHRALSIHSVGLLREE